MPRGVKPKPPGTAKRPEQQRHQWNHAVAGGWQHGKRPNPPSGLSPAGVKAWQTWLSAWWACFYSTDDLPGLELLVRNYDACLLGHLDVAKVLPLMDRYGITPKGRQDLRWAEPVAEQAKDADPVSDDLAARRAQREAAVS